jgi:hypothetical protein
VWNLPLAVILRFRRVRGTLGRYAFAESESFLELCSRLPPTAAQLHGIQVGQLLGISLKFNLIKIRIYVFQKYIFSSDLVNCYIATAGIPVSLLVMDLAH